MIGCSGPSGATIGENTSSVEANSCVTKGAAYLIRFTELDGSCGPIPDTTVVVGEGGEVGIPSSCKNGPGAHSNGCEVYTDQTCTGPYGDGSTQYTLKQTGKMVWEADGSGGTGLETVSISTPGSNPCTSTYRVSSTRL